MKKRRNELEKAIDAIDLKIAKLAAKTNWLAIQRDTLLSVLKLSPDDVNTQDTESQDSL